jgi:GWxTD domain-containing protein
MLYPEAQAQRRVSYQDLVRQQRNQNIYVDFFTLPGSDAGQVQFVSTFRIDYSFLPFKKVDNSGENERYFSVVSMSMELFKAKDKVKDINEDVSIEGLRSVSRAFWRDTAYAETYEQTQSNNSFIGGSMQAELEPGLYNYLMQLSRDEYTEEETSRIRQVEILPYDRKSSGNIVFVEKADENADNRTLKLLNFGENVFYGKDFYAFVHLPDFDADASYSYTVSRVEISKRDTTRRADISNRSIMDSHLLTGIRPKLVEYEDAPALELTNAQDGHAYALVKVNNSKLPNAVYRIRVFKNGQEQPVASSVFRSLWLDMPVSLLSLDVAIDMLRFIQDENTVRSLKEGSGEEREKKFRAYWKDKDPTPDTEFNELMAEYYRRIDYAYENFTSLDTPGYESDQGQIYIKYGPPRNIERRYPPGEGAVEIWTYGGSTQFIFQATSGFGDFKLVNR